MTFVVPERAVAAVTVNLIFTSFAFIFVVLRMCSRTLIIKNIGADDLLIAGSMIASIGFLSVFMLQIQNGLGRHITFLELPAFLQALWATIPVYNLALILCKLSITVQCYRVFRTQLMQKIFRTYFIVICIYGLWTVFGSIFTCWPVDAYWAATEGVIGVCMDRNAVTFSNAGINIATDLFLVIVPLPLIRGLQIPNRQKIILLGIFGAGLFACAVSIVRLQSLYQIGIAPPAEQSVQGVDIAIWSCIEINTAIMCASVPALKPLVVKVFPKMLLSEMYARTRKAYAGASGSNSSSSANHSRVGTAHGAPGHGHGHGRSSSKKGSKSEIHVTVQQSFEMRSLPENEPDEAPASGSPLGSEHNLVIQHPTWQADCYSTHGGSNNHRSEHAGGRANLGRAYGPYRSNNMV